MIPSDNYSIENMIKIYDIIFYASYKIMKKSKNFDDFPVLGGVIYVSVCLLLNIGTVLLLLERIFNISLLNFSPERYSIGKIIFATLIVILPMVYYNWKGRYKKIIQYYNNKKMISNWVIVIFFIIVSFILLLLAGLFRNRDWIFG